MCVASNLCYAIGWQAGAEITGIALIIAFLFTINCVRFSFGKPPHVHKQFGGWPETCPDCDEPGETHDGGSDGSDR